jgi:hypothetical protein
MIDMEIIKKYQTQYEEFCKITDFNLEETTKRVPAEKHFWVCRLIDAKIERDKLFKLKATTKQNMEQKLLKDAPVKLNKQYLDQVEKTPSVEAINEKIRDLDFLVEYLDRIVGQITFISQDIKNIIEIKKLEQS